MSIVARFFSLLFLLLISTVLLANPNYRGNHDEYDSYMGLGFKQYWVRPKSDWRKLFKANTPGFLFFAGWRFQPNFSLELGYEWTADNPKMFLLNNNDSLFSSQNTTGQNLSIEGKVRFKSGYADINVLFPLRLTEDFAPEGIFSFGIASVKPIIRLSNPNENQQNAAATTYMDQFRFIEGRSKAVPRIGFGLQTNIFGDVGVRVLWRFEKTSVLRFRNGPFSHGESSRVLFDNAQTLSISIFKRV